MLRRRPLASLALPLALVCQATASPPEEEPARLLELRSIYEKERRTIRAAAIARHLVKLEALHLALTGENNLADAAVVREHIVRHRRELRALGGGDAGPGVKAITLTPDTARLQGALKKSSRYIRNWTSPGDSATWTRRGVPGGRYDVYLDYLPVVGGGGIIDIRSSDGSASLRVEGGTRDKLGQRSAKIGAMNIAQDKAVTIRIAPRSRSREGVFLLTGVRFVPVAPR